MSEEREQERRSILDRWADDSEDLKDDPWSIFADPKQREEAKARARQRKQAEEGKGEPDES